VDNGAVPAYWSSRSAARAAITASRILNGSSSTAAATIRSVRKCLMSLRSSHHAQERRLDVIKDGKWLDDPFGGAVRLVLAVDMLLAAVADLMADHGRQIAPRRHRVAPLFRDIDRRRAQIVTNRSGTTRGSKGKWVGRWAGSSGYIHITG
jgi:hypothetical protein